MHWIERNILVNNRIQNSNHTMIELVSQNVFYLSTIIIHRKDIKFFNVSFVNRITYPMRIIPCGI